MLQSILAAKKIEVERQKAVLPESRLGILRNEQPFRLQQCLRERPWSLIAECKLASPSRGVLSSGKSVTELASLYEANGAGVLSILTDRHFHGSLDQLKAVRRQTNMPILRKDFVVDRYQIVESAAAGADVILLIAAALDQGALAEYLSLATSYGLDAIVEVHTHAEVEKVAPLKPAIIGINNRDLHTFKTDVEQTVRLLPLCPPESLVISESGLFEAEQARRLQTLGVRGCLVGEGLVTAPDIGAKVRQLALTDVLSEMKRRVDESHEQ